MSQNYSRPPQTRHLLERYHKHRRRQLALFAGIGAVAVVVAGLGVLVYLLLNAYGHSLAPPDTGRPAGKRGKAQYARLARLREFTPAPWFIALDDERLYTALDSKLAATEPPNLPVDTLAAYAFKGQDAAWQNSQEQLLSLFGVAGGNVLCLREVLSTTPGFEISAYNCASGAATWQVREPLAEDCQAAMDGKVVIVAYRQNQDYRIVGYNAETGVKAWVHSVGHGGVSGQDLSTPGSELALYASQGAVMYRLGVRCGLLASGTGKLLRRVKAPGYVYGVEYDKGLKLMYVLSADAARSSVLLQCLPLSGGSVEMCRFTAGAALDPLLVAEQGYVALAYSAPGAGGELVQKVLCFAANGAKPVLAQEYAQGVVWDIAPLPMLPGEFLLALCEGLDENRRPLGWSELHRLRAPAQTAWKLQRLNKPILICVPFKEDCLVLVQGGDVYSYRGAGKLKRLKRLAYPNLDAVPSPSQAHLVVTSCTEDYLLGKPGQALQVAVFE